MTEIASLGLQVDSRPVTQAVTELNKLVPAAKAAEAATKGFETAAAGAAGAIPKVGTGAKETAVNLSALEKAMQAVTADINLHERALANGTTSQGRLSQAAAKTQTQFKGVSFEARNLGFQLVDVTQGFAMGQSAGMIFAQQAGQIGQIIATSPNGLGGLMRELGRSVVGMITPLRLLGVGAVAAGVGAYAMNAAWKSSALELDNTARAIGTTVSQLRVLERAASLKGVEDFSKDAERLAGYIYQARNGMGSLGDILRANGERATDFVGTMDSLSRILQRATSDQQRLQILQQAGLPATMAHVRLLTQSGDAIARAANEATGFVGKEQELIDKARQFDETMSGAWRSATTAGQSYYLKAKGWLTDLAMLSARSRAYFNPDDSNARTEVGFGSLGNYQNKPLQNGLEAAAARLRGDKPAVDPMAAARALAIESPFVGMLGTLATVAADKAKNSDDEKPVANDNQRENRDSNRHRRAA